MVLNATIRLCKIQAVLSIILICFGLFIAGCSCDNSVQSPDSLVDRIDKKQKTPEPGYGEFTIEAKYSWIRSYPGGGGIFVVRLVPGTNYTGNVILSINADLSLSADLDRQYLNAQSPVAEIAIRPKKFVEITTHTIELTAFNFDNNQSVYLEIEVVNLEAWQSPEANAKRNDFTAWLADEHPEFGNLTNNSWFSYLTYPYIWVVEHWTHLDDKWELRVCHHVMIPPYDWSMMLLRKRGEWDPAIAARREYDSTAADYVIFEIPVSEYPTMMGY